MHQNDTALSPAHYKDFNIEAIAICSQFSFCLGNALKYIIRAGKKDTYSKDGTKINTYKQDLQKALVYLDFYFELDYEKKLLKLDKKILRDYRNFFASCNNDILREFATSINYEYDLNTLRLYLTRAIDEVENEQ